MKKHDKKPCSIDGIGCAISSVSGGDIPTPPVKQNVKKPVKKPTK